MGCYSYLAEIREKSFIKYSRDYKKHIVVDGGPELISFISKWYNLLYLSPSNS